MPKLNEVNVDVGLLQALFIGLCTLVATLLLGVSWVADWADDRIATAVTPLKDHNSRLETQIIDVKSELRSSVSRIETTIATLDSSKNAQYGELRSLLLELGDVR